MNLLMTMIISILIGFILSLIIGKGLIPILKNTDITQRVSKKINDRHLRKNGTPTMGGLIFFLSTLLSFFILLILKKIAFNSNVVGIIVIFISFAFLGYYDDYLKIKKNNNEGISIINKLTLEFIISLVFFILYLLNGNDTYFIFYNFKYLYGFIIFLILVGTSNAVNITDGLDGLAGGLAFMAFMLYGILAIKFNYIAGHEQIAIFCFLLSGSLLGFLYFNFYPAKIFMGDLGSLALGGTLAAVAITLRIEESLLIVGIIFIIETLSSFLQIVSINYYHKKIFLKSPLHHHFEEKGYSETEIIKLFYLGGIIAIFIALIIYI